MSSTGSLFIAVVEARAAQLTSFAIQMPQGLFIGLSEAELLAIKAKAVSLITAGVTTTSYSDSGTSVGKAITLPAKEMLAESLMALQLLNPAVYGERITVIRTDWSNTKD